MKSYKTGFIKAGASIYGKSKKTVAVFLCLAILFSVFGCTNRGGLPDNPDENNNKKPPIDYNENTDKYLVKNSVTEYKIVVSENATPTENAAAISLQNYINMAVDCKISVKNDANAVYNSNDKVISIGKTKYQENAGLSNEYYKDLNGGYIIVSVGSVYILDSDTKNGILYSVNNFLTFFFGIEFLTWDYIHIPKNIENVKAYSADIKDVPTFRIRDFLSYPVWFKDPIVGSQLAMNSPSYKNSSVLDSTFYYGYYSNDTKTTSSNREGHSIESMLCVDAYRNGFIPSISYKSDENGASIYQNYGYWGQHEDWYAYDPLHDRSNKKGRSHEDFCYSNGLDDNGDYDISDTGSFTNKIVEICISMLKEEISENAYYLMLGHGDYEAQCKCSDCKNLYKKFGENFSGLYCVWANEVAKEVKKRMQEENIDKSVKFVILSYTKSIQAPVVEENKEYKPINPKVVLDEDIVVKMAYINCVYHSVWDNSCQHNQSIRDSFSQWTLLVDEFAIWDYVCNFGDYLWYLPDYGTLKENYTYYKQLNVRHVISQGTPSEYNYYEYFLKCYVSLKLMWNINQNVNDLIQKFNNLYFGEKYAYYVNIYRDIFENQAALLDYQRTDSGGYHASTQSNFSMKSANNYSRDMLEGAIRIIDVAITLAKADETLSSDEIDTLVKRLCSVKITPQYMLLKLGYIIYDEEIRLLATDFFNNVDMLALTYFKEGQSAENTFDKMKESYGI